MSLHIFVKMLARFTTLVISILYLQVSCSQQNGSNVLSNLVLNNSAGIQSQGNILQKSLNQFSKNRVLPNNLHQAVNLQKSQNLHSQGTQQGTNMQQLVNLQTLNNQQPSNLQTVTTQQPINYQSVTTQQPMHLQSVITQQYPNIQSGNTQQTLNLQTGNQQSTLNIQPIGNLQQTLSLDQPINLQQISMANQNSLQHNIQNHNPIQSNVQILRQASDVYSPANGGQIVQTCQGANVPSYSTVTPTAPGATATLCINSADESVPVICPQYQQVSISGVPSYIIDRSQISNAAPASIAYSAQGNQPALLTILAVPQQNQQPIDIMQSPIISVQNPIETPNQITIIKSVQPHLSAVSTNNQDQNQINVVSPVANQAPPLSYSAKLPTVSSILASSLSKQTGKSSNLKALLPLVLNLIKERNSCGCNNQCGCSNNSHSVYENDKDGYKSYLKQKQYGYNHEKNSKYINDYAGEFEEHSRYENRRNSKKHEKNTNATPESVENYNEYEYSDEFYDDY